jgi:mannosyl-oligosaccharide glucosidase
LWDEGFHQLLINRWDPEISMEIMSHWLNSMDSTGWIQREQILGDEARSKVPQEFQPQNPEFANPPTMVLPIERIAHKVLQNKIETEESQVIVAETGDSSIEDILPSNFRTTTTSSSGDISNYVNFLNAAYPRLEVNFKWLMRTQAGTAKNTFRWRGRTVNHTLTSGLDDYPRAAQPSVDEQHVDLLCWMAMLAKSLDMVSQTLGKTDTNYKELYNAWVAALDEYHWDATSQSYCDLETHKPPTYLPHDGYVALFPILLGLVPHDSPKIGPILEVLKNSDKLWSNYGIRSISKQDPYYGTSENYWRGPIWININYMLLSSLYNNYLSKEGPYKAEFKDIYTRLRSNLVDNIYQNYEKTGYIWEQYHPVTGQGQRSHPFTGWSALVVLAMGETY